MEVKLTSASNHVENFHVALRSLASWRKVYIVTQHQEYNNVPSTVLQVFSPYLASLLGSINLPEETPTIIIPELKSVTLKHLVDLLQHGDIQIKGPAQRRKETIGEILELANILNIEMDNLVFDHEDSLPDRVKQEPVRKTDLSDELLLFEENLFCQQLLEKDYFEVDPATTTDQVKQENATAEYFENMTIDEENIEKLEREEDELKDTKALREEGELTDEDENDPEVFKLHCRRCRFGCSSRKELEKHLARYHREGRRESRSPAYKRSRYSTSSRYPKYPRYAVSPSKQMKYQPKSQTQEFRNKFYE